MAGFLFPKIIEKDVSYVTIKNRDRLYVGWMESYGRQPLVL